MENYEINPENIPPDLEPDENIALQLSALIIIVNPAFFQNDTLKSF